MTGLRSWSRYIMRHGEYIVFAEDVKDGKNIEQRLASVPYDIFKKELHSWKSRTDEHKKRFRFKRDPKTYLKSIEEKWIQA